MSDITEQLTIRGEIMAVTDKDKEIMSESFGMESLYKAWGVKRQTAHDFFKRNMDAVEGHYFVLSNGRYRFDEEAVRILTTLHDAVVQKNKEIEEKRKLLKLNNVDGLHTDIDKLTSEERAEIRKKVKNMLFLRGLPPKSCETVANPLEGVIFR